MKEPNFLLTRVLGWIAALCVPYILIMFAVRILINPAFAQLQYSLPNFPEDPYGFTREERLLYARPSIVYLTNNAGIDFLADLTFEDGTPIYNQRELSHMLDVKILVKSTLAVWYGITGLLAVIAMVMKVRGDWLIFRTALGYGGWLTIALMLFGVAGVAVNFDWLFTEFHHLFFEGETWIFLTSDTLIRLFPEKFWMDAFIAAFSITLLGAGLLIWQGVLAQKKQRA
ncbi:MAG: TIGR01906 family membrane protein [Anaerolineae bacterium]|nr:TIGR01906 family membrane protein [Anaerolineae bacterium]